MDEITWLERSLAKPNKKKGELAKAIGLRPSAISELLSGKRQLKLSEAVAAAIYLEEPLPADDNLISVVLERVSSLSTLLKDNHDIERPLGINPRQIAQDVVRYAADALGRQDVSEKALRFVAEKALKSHLDLQAAREMLDQGRRDRIPLSLEDHTSKTKDADT